MRKIRPYKHRVKYVIGKEVVAEVFTTRPQVGINHTYNVIDV